MTFFSLKGKVAVITGGGSGIGLASARRFAAAGARVTIANRSDSTQLAADMGATFIRADVAVEADVEALMSGVAKREGAIDIVVNNAGFGEVGAEVAELSQAVLQHHLDVNLFGVLYGIKYGVPHMHRGGSIVNVSSLAGLVGFPTYGAYVASKWAVVGLTKSAAVELGPRRIRVNCVCPGTIDTPINQQAGAEAELEIVKTIAPLGRIGTPEEVAAAIHFLASDDAGYVTGSALEVDGGWLSGTSMALIGRLVGA
ncbi:MAG: SDR family NAD(P)-dependent oxidoreductase [Gemmatimonadota bacterium]